MRFLCFLIFAGGALHAEVIKNRVVAVVAGEALTQRGMDIEAILEENSRFRKDSAPKMTQEERDRLLQQLIIRIMVSEENRVLKFYRVAKVEVDKRYNEFQRSMGRSRFEAFLEAYELSESDVRKRLGAVALLERTLSDQEDIETWLRQLRSRHRVQVFK